MNTKHSLSTIIALNLAAIITPANAASIDYSYDNLNRLTQVSYSDGRTIKYRYDSAGNMLSTDISGGAPDLTDTDTDKMPDAWELNYGLDPNNASDAPTDLDGDGVTNLQEYLDDTDPTDKNSFVASSITIINTTQKLNDTGITTCSDLNNNNLPCPVTGFPNQDAQFGRDKTANNDADGHAGFSFTKISSTGAVLAANATTWNCVKDNVTGLMWEVKTDDNGLHDKDNTYSWYNPDNSNNGGDAGYQNYGSCVGSSCDTNAFVKAVNTAGWCGYKDWRLPSRAELHSIVDYSRYNSSIDTNYFPNTQSNWYWSASPVAYYSYYAWFVYFHYGFVLWGDKNSDGFVRLVRAGQ
jgi:YD repeat-containing protein